MSLYIFQLNVQAEIGPQKNVYNKPLLDSLFLESILLLFLDEAAYILGYRPTVFKWIPNICFFTQRKTVRTPVVKMISKQVHRRVTGRSGEGSRVDTFNATDLWLQAICGHKKNLRRSTVKKSISCHHIAHCVLSMTPSIDFFNSDL